MKKRIFRERRKEVDETKEIVEKAKSITRAALMQKAKEMGLKVDNKMTKADLERLIEEA